ncbi:MAG TPA: TadE/TadG family type IV pilus assembly protein [Candidatus Acidoferrum sp.]|nr:TadE/TadG family type IV pilus assembly protein [Candidatus Acidoferrum sp.]
MNRAPAVSLEVTATVARSSPAGDLRRSRRFCSIHWLSRLRDERGQALTEFALVLPLLLLLMLGLIDFGKAINYWIDETHLANEGARWAAVNNNPGSGSGLTLQQYILGQVDTAELAGQVKGTQQTAHPANVKICFYKASDGTSEATGAVGDTVEVLVTYNYNWLHFLVSKAGVGPTTTIAGKSAMRLEVPPTYSSDSGCPATA